MLASVGHGRKLEARASDLTPNLVPSGIRARGGYDVGPVLGRFNAGKKAIFGSSVVDPCKYSFGDRCPSALGGRRSL
jgi:hypothetical protein